MKKTSLIVTFGITMLLLSSCAFHGGYIGHSIVTNVELSQNNFTVIDRVSGSASSVKILGFGLSNERMYAEAYNEMVDNAKLKGGAKALANITTDTQIAKFIISSRKTITVSADVIEFTR